MLEKIAVFLSEFDPPTLDHIKAIEALANYGFSVWVCPKTEGHGSNMANIICSEMSFSGKPVIFCNLKEKIQIDKITNWVKKRRKNSEVFLSCLEKEMVPFADLVIKFGYGSEKSKSNIKVVPISQKSIVPKDIKDRIKNKQDMSKYVSRSVWDYIIKNGLFGN